MKGERVGTGKPGLFQALGSWEEKRASERKNPGGFFSRLPSSVFFSRPQLPTAWNRLGRTQRSARNRLDLPQTVDTNISVVESTEVTDVSRPALIATFTFSYTNTDFKYEYVQYSCC